MTECVSILGSTGSIGTQALEVCDKLGVRVAAITANSNTALLEEQIRRFKPKLAVIGTEKLAGELKIAVSDTDTKISFFCKYLVSFISSTITQSIKSTLKFFKLEENCLI